ncbi:MAG TPA: helix-turn-helix transcriptional regulator [Micromonosporaceae bacterium]
MPAETLGALLTRVRQAQGRTQLRVAELLCAASGIPTVTRHEVSRWEREQRLPSGYWLRWLAVVLEVPLDELERAAAASRRWRASRPAVDRAGPGRRLASVVWLPVAPGVHAPDAARRAGWRAAVVNVSHR